jgi:hypothetical protein
VQGQFLTTDAGVDLVAKFQPAQPIGAGGTTQKVELNFVFPHDMRASSYPMRVIVEDGAGNRRVFEPGDYHFDRAPFYVRVENQNKNWNLRPPTLDGFGTLESTEIAVSTGLVEVVFGVVATDYYLGSYNGNVVAKLPNGPSVQGEMVLEWGTTTSATLIFTPGLPKGDYMLQVNLINQIGATATYKSADLAKLGFPSKVTVL